VGGAVAVDSRNAFSGATSPCAGDTWQLDEAPIKLAGVKHRLWSAADQAEMALDALVQRRCDMQAAKRLPRKLLKRRCRALRVRITDKLPDPTFHKALGQPHTMGPHTITVGKSAARSGAAAEMRMMEQGTRRVECLVRPGFGFGGSTRHDERCRIARRW